jgi:hypothetical protein
VGGGSLPTFHVTLLLGHMKSQCVTGEVDFSAPSSIKIRMMELYLHFLYKLSTVLGPTNVPSLLIQMSFIALTALSSLFKFYKSPHFVFCFCIHVWFVSFFAVLALQLASGLLSKHVNKYRMKCWWCRSNYCPASWARDMNICLDFFTFLSRLVSLLVFSNVSVVFFAIYHPRPEADNVTHLNPIILYLYDLT